MPCQALTNKHLLGTTWFGHFGNVFHHWRIWSALGWNVPQEGKSPLLLHSSTKKKQRDDWSYPHPLQSQRRDVFTLPPCCSISGPAPLGAKQTQPWGEGKHISPHLRFALGNLSLRQSLQSKSWCGDSFYPYLTLQKWHLKMQWSCSSSTWTGLLRAQCLQHFT